MKVWEAKGRPQPWAWSVRPDLWGPGVSVSWDPFTFAADYGRQRVPGVDPELSAPGLVEATMAARGQPEVIHMANGVHHTYAWVEVDP